MGLGFFGKMALSFLHYLFALLVPLSLLVSRVRLRGLGTRRSGGFGLDDHLRRVAPCMGLQRLQKAHLGFVLKHHRFRYTWGFLDTTYLGWRKVAEVSN